MARNPKSWCPNACGLGSKVSWWSQSHLDEQHHPTPPLPQSVTGRQAGKPQSLAGGSESLLPPLIAVASGQRSHRLCSPSFGGEPCHYCSLAEGFACLQPGILPLLPRWRAGLAGGRRKSCRRRARSLMPQQLKWPFSLGLGFHLHRAPEKRCAFGRIRADNSVLSEKEIKPERNWEP